MPDSRAARARGGAAIVSSTAFTYRPRSVRFAGSPRTALFVDVPVLVAIVAVLLIWPLHSPPISSHGEAREGLVVQDIVRTDRWVLPRRNGELPSKPPLFHWIAALAAGESIPSDAGVRAPSALAAIAMAVATFLMGAQAGTRVAGWLSVGALLGMYHYWATASQARVDMLFAACVTVSLAAFYRWYRAGSPIARACCYLAAAAAVLVKGPVGAALPALIIVAFLLRERWRGERGSRVSLAALWSWPLVALAVTIDAGWYALAYLEGGREFLELQLVRENADRFLGQGVFGMHGGRSRLSMLHALATDVLPWNLVLVWAAVRWWRGAREDEAGRFLHAWWITIVLFFTIAYGKRDVYLLPLYPALALLVGRALANALADADRERALGWLRLPAAITRRFPARPALATIAVAIVAFDLILILTSQLVREHRGRRRSLVGFAGEVRTLVPPDAPLNAAPEIPVSDALVLAYRLGRPLPQTVVSAPDVPSCDGTSPPAGAHGEATASRSRDAYYLLPASAASDLPTDRATIVLRSDRRERNVALVRVAGPGACGPPDAKPPDARTAR